MSNKIVYYCKSACGASCVYNNQHDDSTVKEYFSTEKYGIIRLCKYQVDHAASLGWLRDGNTLKLVDNNGERINVSAITMPAVNDYICPTCQIDRVSKTEDKCWWCGNPLHITDKEKR
jgi:hypothetical protein